MYSATTTGILPVTGAAVAGFTISSAVGAGVLAVVAGTGLIVAASSRWKRHRNDRHLGVTA